jgi:predicted tellurium resistance membrane protein TerC
MVDPLIWLVFGAAIVAMLATDLIVAGRSAGPVPSMRAAAWWSAGWTAVALAFAVLVLVWRGEQAASEYVTGFVLERSLSLDNLFVFAMLFGYLAVPRQEQRRVLFFGIVGAIVLRLVFILAGGALLDAFHWSIYLFGALLVATGVRMALHGEDQISDSRVLRTVRRIAPGTAAPLILVAVFDVIFAVDSIPAIFAVTRDTFTVFAANAFSLLGLASLYFLLAGMRERFRHLSKGLAVVLVFIGIKMMITDLWHVPTELSLAVILVVLGASVLASPRRTAAR